MSRDERVNRRSQAVQHVVTDEDRRPQTTILPILHAHAGSSIIIRVYRNGRIRRRGTIKDGRDTGTHFTFYQEAYDVPMARAEINKKFRGTNQEGWFWDWKTGSDQPGGFHLEIGDEIRVFEASLMVPRFSAG